MYADSHSFTVGDQVVVRRTDRPWENYRYRLGTVAAVTASGQIRLSDGSRFLPDRYRIGGASEQILPATQDNLVLYREEVLRANVESKAKALLSSLGRLKLIELEEAWQGICRATGEPNAELHDPMYSSTARR